MFGVFLAARKGRPAGAGLGSRLASGGGVNSPAMDLRLIDQKLPRPLRGAEGFERMLRQAKVRVSVASPREHLRLAAMVMETLRARSLSVYPEWAPRTDPWTLDPAREDEGTLGIDRQRLMYEVKRAWPVDALVLRNRSATPADFRSFHARFLRPHFVLVSRVTRDPWGELAPTREGMAELIGRSMPRDATLISGEPNPELKEILRENAEEAGARFIDASPVGAALPNLEFITIVDAMLHAWRAEGLSADELRRWRERIQQRYRWRPSSVPELEWFHAVDLSLADADAIATVVQTLNRQRRRPLVIAAYLRNADAGHNYPAVPFLRRLLDEGSLAAAYLLGPGAAAVANHFRQEPIFAVPDTPAYVAKFLAHLAAAHRGHGLMTLASGAPPWGRAMAEALHAPPGNAGEVTLRLQPDPAPPPVAAVAGVQTQGGPDPAQGPEPMSAAAPPAGPEPALAAPDAAAPSLPTLAALPPLPPPAELPPEKPTPLAQRLLQFRRALASGSAAPPHP